MGNIHYMISEAARQVNVETHVLRYWEDELSLIIGRTEMGHRYYTKDDIQLFCCIKELKEQGLQLKELKALIPDMIRTKNHLKLKKATILLQPENLVVPEPATELIQEKPSIEGTDKLEQFKTVIQETMQDVMVENNKVLSQTVIQGMDFLLQAKERQEEERYKNLDQLIRQQQHLRKEAAKTSHLGRWKKILEMS